MDERERTSMKPETKAIHIGEEPNFLEGGCGDVVVPIHLSSTFAREKLDKPPRGYEYSRTANPTRDALEKRLAALEGAKFALAFSSGLAAETTLLLSILEPNSHIIAVDDIYYGTKRLLETTIQTKLNCSISYLDLSRDPYILTKSAKDNTRLIWIESPTNPLLKIVDIAEVSRLAKKLGALVVVDNTFATPCFQNPLELGADIVVHSTTKYINGHSDSIGGAIMLNDERIYEKLKFNQNAIGAILSPFDSFLVLRGIKTIFVRMREHEKNATIIAEYLEAHPKVERVFYPGLKSHPQHALAKRMMKGFGGMISFIVKADGKGAKKFVESLRIIMLAESLGGVESLVEIPSLMTHSALTEKEKNELGISDNLIRLSVGIENPADLIEDLESAFKSI